ncbi:NOTCH1 [Lepeophtheirus salmonis]|uniref:NOTCH1 n=1 Tax=Lepeophtheirus salmonis TaxID=72036 RepID=A0A7R8HD93_LEPSM|nr:NOTCH1 [Lepeophtheirus salmonis]CAF3025638.1 NOTCH1 [Lepeophtheirus salmonis]
MNAKVLHVRNNGLCIDLIAGYKCDCPSGYYGPRCTSDVNECSPDPCLNGATCENEFNDYVCRCQPGYEGKRCEYEVNECKSNPCQHGGKCLTHFNSYSCICPSGFTGNNCESNIDDCRLFPCKNSGLCIDQVDGFKCICSAPYTGKTCESEMNPCNEHSCAANGAVCKPTPDYKDYFCSCPLGFKGRYCSVDIDECLTYPCHNGASCVNTEGSYECKCEEGFEGRDCLLNIDDCASSPCVNGGTCLDETAGFKCLCVDGFGGNLCEEDINECASNPCKNGAICHEYVNSYTSSSCMNGGKCIDGVNNYTCVCPRGYSGRNCQTRINPCDKNPCQNNGTCVDGGYNDYSCHCSSGWTGRNCDRLVDWCQQGASPCENGRCYQSGTSYNCVCEDGWTGKVCDVRKVSCRIAAKLRSVDVSDLCLNGGRCRDEWNSHVCECQDGFYGSYCQYKKDECGSSPCQNGASCKSMIGTYSCQCLRGFQGHNCEFNIDECDPNPCQNEGVCHDLIDGFQCTCPYGTVGKLCEFNINECLEGTCHHGGTCIDKIGGYECQCRPGFVGQRCEGDINECLTSRCSPYGTQDCIQLTNAYKCQCKPDYMGKYCETKKNFYGSGHKCSCLYGYSGQNCEFYGSVCQSNPCRHGGTCLEHSGGGFTCVCPPGTTGSFCEQDTRNECAYNPCQKGYCIDKIGDYDSEEIDLRTEKIKCLQNGCQTKAGNNICEKECNTYACDFDGGDCRLGINLWMNCNATVGKEQKRCWEVFQNDYCNEECNNRDCLFDGRDCDGDRTSCNSNYDVYCTDHYANGRCDESCNNEACGWDGLDCEPPSEIHRIIPGSFYVVLHMTLEAFNSNIRKRFERYLSLELGTNFRIKKDLETDEEMIYNFNPALLSGKFSNHAFDSTPFNQGNSSIIVYLEIDNVKCVLEERDNCIGDATGYANHFSAVFSDNKLREPWGIAQVGASGSGRGSGLGSGSGNSNVTYSVIGIMIVLIVLAIGIVTQKNKKRKGGITWFPDGFFTNNNHASSSKSHAQEMFPSYGSGVHKFEVPHHHFSQKDYPIDGWSDDGDMSEHHPSKRQKRTEYSSGQTVVTDYEEDHNGDQRTWTKQHLNAADIKNPDLMGALTPPQGEVIKQEQMTNDPDVRGPMGMTPLMIASFRGGGLDTGVDPENVDEDGDGSPAIIADLINQGANLTSQMDKSGESPLHLAARYARADAAKKLLDAGADANAEDFTGRSPLHAAIAADAQGAYDGTTPLILAARLAIEGMVEDLINAEADINASDDNGKTALHWASAVNNVEAVNVLLANGANRDAQDAKDETPLFLSAREGSYQAARVLLDHCANRDIQDHMDRLPVTIAREKLHHDIVTLLEEHIPPAPQMNKSPQFNPQLLGSPPMMGHHVPGKRGPNKRKAKDDFGNNTLPRQPHQRKPSVKKSTKKSIAELDILLTPEGGFKEEPKFSPLAGSHPNLDELFKQQHLRHHQVQGTAHPPSYEAALLGRSMHALQGGMPGQSNLESQYNNSGNNGGGGFPPPPQQQQLHSRQQSMPVSINSYNNQTPPHVNLSPSHVPGVMSPPHSVQSSTNMSPPQQAILNSIGNNNNNPSPVNHHLGTTLIFQQVPLTLLLSVVQRLLHDNSHLISQQQQQVQQQQQPPSQRFYYSQHQGMTTPSPDSPGITLSPQSEWSSEGNNDVHSPPSSSYPQQYLTLQQQQQVQQAVQSQQGVIRSDGVLI